LSKISIGTDSGSAEFTCHALVDRCSSDAYVERKRALAKRGCHEESKRRQIAASPAAESTGPTIIEAPHRGQDQVGVTTVSSPIFAAYLMDTFEKSTAPAKNRANGPDA